LACTQLDSVSGRLCLSRIRHRKDFAGIGYPPGNPSSETSAIAHVVR
jgi:hypothetical protein